MVHFFCFRVAGLTILFNHCASGWIFRPSTGWSPSRACGRLAPTPHWHLSNTVPSSTTTSLSDVTLKVAVDLDRGAAEQKNVTVSERFTCDVSLDMVHRLRARSDAVLVGKATVMADDPSLLVRRGVSCKVQPLRVVLDPSLSLLVSPTENSNKKNTKSVNGTVPVSSSYQIFRDGQPTVVYHSCPGVSVNCTTDLPNVHLAKVKSPSAKTTTTPTSTTGRLSPHDVVQDLRSRFDVKDLMVEGGPATARSFLEADLVDRCLLVLAPVLFEDPLPSGLTEKFLSRKLECCGVLQSGVDCIQCWTRPDVPWPSEELRDWP